MSYLKFSLYCSTNVSFHSDFSCAAALKTGLCFFSCPQKPSKNKAKYKLTKWFSANGKLLPSKLTKDLRRKVLRMYDSRTASIGQLGGIGPQGNDQKNLYFFLSALDFS